MCPNHFVRRRRKFLQVGPKKKAYKCIVKCNFVILTGILQGLAEIQEITEIYTNFQNKTRLERVWGHQKSMLYRPSSWAFRAILGHFWPGVDNRGFLGVHLVCQTLPEMMHLFLRYFRKSHPGESEGGANQSYPI